MPLGQFFALREDLTDAQARSQRQDFLARHFGDLKTRPLAGAFVGFAQKRAGDMIRQTVPVAMAKREAECLDHTLDTYITIAEYNAPRAINDNLAGSRCCYLEIDFDKAILPFTGDVERWARAVVFDWCACHDIPRPSEIVFTGGGLHAYWRFDSWVPDNSRLRRVQADMVKLGATIGADQAAKDMTRILRLPGTRSRKRGVWVQTVYLGPVVSFDKFADAVLLKPRAELNRLRSKRPRASKRGEPKKRASNMSRRLAGLGAWAKARGPLNDGRRRFLYHRACAWAFALPPDQITDQAERDRQEFCPNLPANQVRGIVAGVVSQARKAARGERNRKTGDDPRYTPSRDTIATSLGMTSEEQDLYLPARDPEAKRRYDRHYQAHRRRERGDLTRHEYRAQVKKEATKRQEVVIYGLGQGLKPATLANVTGYSRGHVYRIKRANSRKVVSHGLSSKSFEAVALGQGLSHGSSSLLCGRRSLPATNPPQNPKKIKPTVSFSRGAKAAKNFEASHKRSESRQPKLTKNRPTPPGRGGAYLLPRLGAPEPGITPHSQATGRGSGPGSAFFQGDQGGEAVYARAVNQSPGQGEALSGPQNGQGGEVTKCYYSSGVEEYQIDTSSKTAIQTRAFLKRRFSEGHKM